MRNVLLFTAPTNPPVNASIAASVVLGFATLVYGKDEPKGPATRIMLQGGGHLDALEDRDLLERRFEVASRAESPTFDFRVDDAEVKRVCVKRGEVDSIFQRGETVIVTLRDGRSFAAVDSFNVLARRLAGDE
jgi:hypothetical protein